MSNISNKNSILNVPLVFFTGLYFLIFVLFYASWINALNFIIFQDSTRPGSLIGKILFLLFFIIHLVKPSIGNVLLKTLLDSRVFNFFSKYIEKIHTFSSKNPYLTFILIYFYLI